MYKQIIMRKVMDRKESNSCGQLVPEALWKNLSTMCTERVLLLCFALNVLCTVSSYCFCRCKQSSEGVLSWCLVGNYYCGATWKLLDVFLTMSEMESLLLIADMCSLGELVTCILNWVVKLLTNSLMKMELVQFCMDELFTNQGNKVMMRSVLD